MLQVNITYTVEKSIFVTNLWPAFELTREIGLWMRLDTHNTNNASRCNRHIIAIVELCSREIGMNIIFVLRCRLLQRADENLTKNL